MSCFSLSPQWRERPGKAAAGHDDDFVLVRPDGFVVTPGAAAPPDAKLTTLSKMQVQTLPPGMRQYALRANAVGELILPVHEPTEEERRNLDGSLGVRCYELARTPDASQRSSPARRPVVRSTLLK